MIVPMPLAMVSLRVFRRSNSRASILEFSDMTEHVETASFAASNSSTEDGFCWLGGMGTNGEVKLFRRFGFPRNPR
jgi:hypothetical protein